MRLRQLTLNDIPEAMHLKDAVGWNQTPRDWERLLSASPLGCFAAEHGGRVVGTATTIVYGGRLGWIGMVVVDSQHRRKGIGTALLERAIGHLDSRNVPSVKLDATPQGQPLYERLGFVGEYAVERWMLSRRRTARVPSAAPIGLDALLELDREAFGADRSAVLRSVARDAPELALMAPQPSGVAGCSLGRRGARADHLGPWMARDEAAGATLLDEFLRRSDRELVFVDCVRPNPWAAALLQARGFVLSRSLTRMYRGSNRYAGRPELVGGILGPEFG
jgi:GNAT superfamily N-acetyltransferase